MRFSALDGLTIGVWGAGAEIASLAEQVDRHLDARIAVLVLDDPAELTPAAEALRARGARVTPAARAVGALSGCDVVIRSPGVSIHRDELRALRARGVPVTTATALWLAERGGRGVIGVTGTKGKSTTASLIAALLRAAGEPVHLAGNIGRPALDLLGVPEGDPVVVELSSHQTADLGTGPATAVLTNLHKEHVDWHGSEAAYRADKLRLLGLPGVSARVIDARDAAVAAAVAGADGVRRFEADDGWSSSDAGVACAGEVVVDAAGVPLRGAHNRTNLCAALTAAGFSGEDRATITAALASFRPLRHRLEVVREDGRTWVDDSISTTPESARAAIESFPRAPIVLIGGGQDRDQDYRGLARLLRDRGAAVVGVPATGERLVAAARAAGVPVTRARLAPDLPAAIAAARELAPPGAVILLSPAAPSYGTYRNFEARGDHFRDLANVQRAVGSSAPAPRGRTWR